MSIDIVYNKEHFPAQILSSILTIISIEMNGLFDAVSDILHSPSNGHQSGSHTLSAVKTGHNMDNNTILYQMCKECGSKPISDQIKLFHQIFEGLINRSISRDSVMNSLVPVLPMFSRFVAYYCCCIPAESVFSTEDARLKDNVMTYFQQKDQDQSFTDCVVALLLNGISHANPQQHYLFMLFSPPLSTHMVPVLDQMLKRSAITHNDVLPFLKQCLINYFNFRVASPTSPIFIEQIESCNDKLPEESDLEVEALLSEREYLRTLCQTVPSISSNSLQPLISSLYQDTTLSDCFVGLIVKNQRRIYTMLLRLIESELKSGVSEHISGSAKVYGYMAETEFSELIKTIFPDDIIHENQKEVITELVEVMKDLPVDSLAVGKIRFLITEIRASIITDSKNPINSHLVQLLDSLNAVLANNTAVVSQNKERVINGIESVEPEKRSQEQIMEFIREVEFLNRDTTSSELPKIPKRIKQLYLFRRKWFYDNVIQTVFRMKKTRELKEFELFLYRSKYISEKEHHNYVNNIVPQHLLKEKPVITSVKRTKRTEVTDEKRQRQVYVEERLNAISSTLSPSLTRTEYHSSITTIMNYLLSDDNESIHEVVLSSFFDQLFLFFFDSRTYFYWCFEEWNQVLLLLHNPSNSILSFVSSWNSVESIGKRLSILCGLLFLVLSRIQKEEETKSWTDLIHQIEKQIIILNHTKNNVMSIFIVEAVLLSIDGCITVLSKDKTVLSDDLLLFHGILVPQSLLDLITIITVMHSDQNPSTMTHLATYSYSPFGASEGLIYNLLDFLFGLSLTVDPVSWMDDKAVSWKRGWVHSIDGVQIIGKLIEIFNSYPSPIFVFNSHPSDDDWCDWVGDEWMGHFLSIPQADTSVSFTLSSSMSYSSSQPAYYYYNSRGFISFLAAIDCFHSFKSIENVVSSLEQHIISPSSFSQYCIIISIIAGIMAELSFQPSESEVLGLLSSLARIHSLPSCVLYPFISHLYHAPFDSLQTSTQLILVRCFPLFAHSTPYIQDHAAASIRRYIKYLVCQSPIKEPPPQWNELTLCVFIEWLKVMLHRNRLEKRMAKEMQHRIEDNTFLYRGFVMFLVTHFSALEESIHPFLLLVCRGFVEENPQQTRELFFRAHNCPCSINILLIIVSLDNELIEKFIDNESLIPFLDVVLCTEGACKKAHQESVCHCLKCKEGEEENNDLELVRPFILQLRPRVLQILRLLFRAPSSHSHPYYSLLLSYYPSLF